MGGTNSGWGGGLGCRVRTEYIGGWIKIMKTRDLRPWFAEDIANALRGISSVLDREHFSDEYLKGFAACIWAICKIIGIDPDEIIRR